VNPLIAVPAGIVFVMLILVPLELAAAKNMKILVDFYAANFQQLLYLAAAWYLLLHFAARRIAEVFLLGERGRKVVVVDRPTVNKGRTTLVPHA
jgi:hypothetical protein